MANPRRAASRCLLLVATAVGCRGPAPRLPLEQVAQPPTAWETFWSGHGVTPAPPPGFLDEQREVPRIVNLTSGLLDDAVARRWVMADVRRGVGESWASRNMRDDLIAADVFGPPGLNGVDGYVADRRAAGVREFRCPPSPIVAAAVVAIPPAVRRQLPSAMLTAFVIVKLTRSSGQPCTRTFVDGTTETVPATRAAGELSWQLDTGELRDDPAIGPVWYQARGWACDGNGAAGLDQICGLLQP